MSDLVLSLDNRLSIGGELTGIGWRLPSDLTPEKWREAGQLLAKIEQSQQWWLADWWNAGVANGDGQKVCEEIGIEYQTAMNCGSIGNVFDFSRRREKLTFTHHSEVCAIGDHAVQDRMLDWCLEPLAKGENRRSTRELREQVRAYLDEQGWTPKEKKRRAAVLAGQTIVLNQKADERLIRWAQFEGLLVKIDRSTDWGNPYELPDDGERDEVCDSFAVYFARKHGLMKRIHELKGKALACWCHPQRCHGDHLAQLANELTEEE